MPELDEATVARISRCWMRSALGLVSACPPPRRQPARAHSSLHVERHLAAEAENIEENFIAKPVGTNRFDPLVYQS